MPYVLMTLITAGVAAGILRKYRNEDFRFRAYAVLSVMLAGFLFAWLWCGVIDAAYFTWNFARLAATYAVKMGYRLYYPADSGPMLGTIYGPIGILAYLPATVAQSPTVGVLIAAAMNCSFFLLPLPWLFHRVCRQTKHRGILLLSALVAGSASVMASSFSFFAVHCDAPTLSLALLACIPLLRRRADNENLDFFLSALFASLAFWCKQTAGVLVLVLPAYILLSEGYRSCGRYVARLIPIFALVSTVVLLAFGPRELYFNVFVVPYRHLGIAGALSAAAFLRALGELLFF